MWKSGVIYTKLCLRLVPSYIYEAITVDKYVGYHKIQQKVKLSLFCHILLPVDWTVEVVECLLTSPDGSVKLAGLGAQDSLWLEAGMCLYGNYFDERYTLVEASIAWTMCKCYASVMKHHALQSWLCVNDCNNIMLDKKPFLKMFLFITQNNQIVKEIELLSQTFRILGVDTPMFGLSVRLIVLHGYKN